MNYITLNNGIKIPQIGFGTWKASPKEAENSVLLALEAGYRLIDTAKIYGNEAEVGKAIEKSGIPREDIFVTTKLWNPDQGYESALKAIDDSLERLGLSYVDLYLMHWPFADWPMEAAAKVPNKRNETWKAMEEIQKSGKAKSIGVSNYTIQHLEEMKDYAEILPAVNQIEMHPFLDQSKLISYCEENNIIVEAYCPLVHGEKLQDERISKIAEKYQKTNAQVLLRWSVQKGCVPLPKSSSKKHIEENLDVWGFEISDEDMKALDSLNENYRIASDPNSINP